MKNIFLIIVFIFGLSAAVEARKASTKKTKDSHDHGEEKEHSNHNHGKEEDNHDHGKNANHDNDEEKKSGHDHGKNHEHEEEEGGKNVGPNKGVTSMDKEKGFTLSEEARKKFSIETEMITGDGPWKLPESALLLTGEEKNIYRYRNETFKRIEIQILEKNGSQFYLNSSELKSGDSVVVNGVGFIRTAELDATSGESGHHH